MIDCEGCTTTGQVEEKKVRAVTFDVWDTLLVDGSDEAKREAAGLPPKSTARRALLHQFLLNQSMQKGKEGSSSVVAPPPPTLKAVSKAYDCVDAAAHSEWHSNAITWTVRERLCRVLEALGCNASASAHNNATKMQNDAQCSNDDDDHATSAFDALVTQHEEMELCEVLPDVVPGAHDALHTLSQQLGYRLGIVSDTIFSPGRVIREILRENGLLHFFSAFVFSDEHSGRSKPDPSLFHAAAVELGVRPEEMVHVGDRELNDVHGPHCAGSRAVLFTAAKDRRSGSSSAADAVCCNYSQLPEVIAAMPVASLPVEH